MVRFWLETLGCPKNQVDSDKLAGVLCAEGHLQADSPEAADLVVVNTCAFIEPARQESVETILALSEARQPGARLVVTGCLAERYGKQLARALPEVDQVAGFGVPVTLGPSRKLGVRPGERFDLLNLPRPSHPGPWAYVKVAEGCDRRCGFCAIPSFRGRQRSRSLASILEEVSSLGVQEVVLVAQDLVSFGRDLGRLALEELVLEVSRLVRRVRLLYLYPSGLSESLIEVMGETGCPYFDLSLQHASGAHLKRMRRYGDRHRFAERIEAIRRRCPEAALRSSFIVGYPGETEDDHEELLEFLEQAQLDWAGFFAFSAEEGTLGARSPDQVPTELVSERLSECSELQDRITASRRTALIGSRLEVLVDSPGVGRSYREAPEIDGIVRLPRDLPVGSWQEVVVSGSEGPDLFADPLEPALVSRVSGGRRGRG